MKWTKKFLKFITGTVKWVFIVLCVFICSLFFRQQKIPGEWITRSIEKHLPTNLVVAIDSATLGFRYGVSIEGLRLYDKNATNMFGSIVTADSISIDVIRRRLNASGLVYARLPQGYYSPENKERNSHVDFTFCDLKPFKIRLDSSNILGVKFDYMEANVLLSAKKMEVKDIFIKWPEREERLSISGHCVCDIENQLVHGEVEGFAKQSHIRPMLEVIDVPVALPYMDSFTDVLEPVKASCRWQVNLMNSDLDLWLDLHPTQCRYNTVHMAKADGKIHLHNYTRNDCLNYKTVIGPVQATTVANKDLSGVITVTGTNFYNVVDIDAKSELPVADILKIAGFPEEYVDNEVYGLMQGQLQFRFPRSMTNNYEVMNGFGHIKIKNGQLMRMKGFIGLIELLADKVPGVAYVTDRTDAKIDYVIENGVLKTDGIYIEGGLFSMKMYGSFDIVNDKLDFTVQTQFMRDKSVMAKIVRPITWVFSKLLLEFKLTGSSDKPEWKYVSVIDRVVDAVTTDKEGDRK
jgi:hypothetical protein